MSQTTTSILPLQLENIVFSKAAQVLLNDISVTLDKYKRTLILGPNGAGKSLFLRLCHGLLAPTAGRLHWAISDQQQLRRQQAMVFQRPVLLRRSVAANIHYALSVRGVARSNRAKLVQQALEQVGLSELARRPARVLSGGEQQRLALARAWALRPQVLFLDEPTANLDPGATKLIENIINEIAEQGTKIIMSSHDLGQARRHADEVLFLYQGQLIEHSEAVSFFDRPQSSLARRFLNGELLD